VPSVPGSTSIRSKQASHTRTDLPSNSGSMTQRQIALFRGINVGKAKRVAMADLRALFEKLGFTEVRTLLNSGNVVYTSDGVDTAKAKQLIEHGIESVLGVSSRTTVLTAAELDEIISAAPLSEIATNPSRHQIAFLSEESGARRLDTVLKQDWAPEAIAVGKRVAYLWCPEGLATSPLMEAAGRALGSAVTVRTWATVQKIQAAAKAG
jgi:uncharacterized protein (DUF1697 family)